MSFLPVQSSNLTAIEYDYPTKTLWISFKASIYEYSDVPLDIFVALLSSSSKGKYHAAHIKWRYTYRKL